MRRRYPQEFEDFFRVYPCGDAKAAAFASWQKLEGLRPSLEVLLAAIERRLRYHEWLDANRKFVPAWPYAATWLNGMRWDDRCEIPTQRAQPAPEVAVPNEQQQQRARMNELAHDCWLRVRNAVLRNEGRPLLGWGHAAADQALAQLGGLDALAARRAKLPQLQGEFVALMVRLMSAPPATAGDNVVMLRRVGE